MKLRQQYSVWYRLACGQRNKNPLFHNKGEGEIEELTGLVRVTPIVHTKYLTSIIESLQNIISYHFILETWL